MTTDQKVNREERVGIMIDSGISETVAQAYCNLHPEIYGETNDRQTI